MVPKTVVDDPELILSVTIGDHFFQGFFHRNHELWPSVMSDCLINEVKQHLAMLVLEWVTV